jgi:hypothetical protein
MGPTNSYPSADGPKWPSFATGHIGDTQITMTDFAACRTGKYSYNRFVGAGQCCVLMCLDMMGYGFPQNNYYMEHNKITSLDEQTGVAQLESPLRHEYVEHYPTWSVGDFFQPDQGGRPTIMTFSIPGGWDRTVTIRNLTVENPNSWFGCARFNVWEDCRFSGFGPVPSQCQSYIMRRCQITDTGLIEVDKFIDYLEYNDCSIYRIQCQSAGTNEQLVVTNNCTVSDLTAGLKYNTVEDSAIGKFTVGAQSYGATVSCTITGCTATSFAGFTRSVTLPTGTFTNMVDGVIRIPSETVRTSNIRLDLIPGTELWYFLGAPQTAQGPTAAFQILDEWRDYQPEASPVINDICYQTTLVGDESAVSFGQTLVVLHPCPNLVVETSSGNDAIAAHSRLGTANAKPLWSYCYRSLSGYPWVQTNVPVYGIFVSMRINVTKPYTGAIQVPYYWPARFGLPLWPDYPVNRWTTKINLGVAGERVVTATSVTGAQSGDSLTAPGVNQWLATASAQGSCLDSGNAVRAWETEDPSVMPEFEFELIVDQGITTPGSP